MDIDMNSLEPRTQGTQLLQRPEGAIAYDSIGDGPLVVCVPGMGDLRSSYRYLAPDLAAAGFRVVTTDLRGHGDSDASFSSYGDEETAEDISALIDHLGAPAVIVGNSMAAGAAVLVAAERPELVSGLVLTGPFVRNPQVGAVARAATTAMMRALMARPWAATVWKAYLPSLTRGTRPTDFAEYRDSLIAAMRRPGYTRAFSLTTRLSHAGAEAALPRVTAPTLVVMGERDPDFSDQAAEAAWIGDRLRASVLMVQDAGHYPHSQRPDLVTPAVIDFARGVATRA